jgi:hypothetical protein
MVNQLMASHQVSSLPSVVILPAQGIPILVGRPAAPCLYGTQVSSGHFGGPASGSLSIWYTGQLRAFVIWWAGQRLLVYMVYRPAQGICILVARPAAPCLYGIQASSGHLYFGGPAGGALSIWYTGQLRAFCSSVLKTGIKTCCLRGRGGGTHPSTLL